MLESHRTEGKKTLGSPAPLENCQEFPTCNSSPLGCSFTTAKRSIMGNSKAFLLTVAFSFLSRTLSVFKGICRDLQTEKLFKILLQHVQLHVFRVLVDK